MRGEVSPPADALLDDGQVLAVGDVSLEILHTPGHTPGSISLACDGALFTGDLILPNGAAPAVELEEADEKALEKSLREVVAPRAASREITIYPGHGESFRFESGMIHSAGGSRHEP